MFLLLLKVDVLNVEMILIVINCYYRVETRGENKTEENKNYKFAYLNLKKCNIKK